MLEDRAAFVSQLKTVKNLTIKAVAAFERKDIRFLKECMQSYQEIFQEAAVFVEQHPDMIETLSTVYREQAEDHLNAAAQKLLQGLSTVIPSASDDFIKMIDAIIAGVKEDE